MLGAPFLWLMSLLGHWGVERSAPIGGGSYSLDKFVYSGLIILLAAAWWLIALAVGLARRDPTLAKRAYLLSGIAFVALVASCLMYGGNLC